MYKTIGKYQVERSLGRGEFGQVFLAKHPTLPLYRAVKLFNAAGQGEDFLREARLQAGLEHERIVKIVDVGLHLERPYLVMEHAPGGGLDALLASGPLEPSRAAALAGDVALALEQAHADSVVHRDLKPGNILLDKNGRAKVADFGLARLLTRNASHQTRLAGTPKLHGPGAVKGRGLPGRGHVVSGRGAVRNAGRVPAFSAGKANSRPCRPSPPKRPRTRPGKRPAARRSWPS